jgi:hypothetical protein
MTHADAARLLAPGMAVRVRAVGSFQFDGTVMIAALARDDPTLNRNVAPFPDRECTLVRSTPAFTAERFWGGRVHTPRGDPDEYIIHHTYLTPIPL